jgi:hypothetical protein
MPRLRWKAPPAWTKRPRSTPNGLVTISNRLEALIAHSNEAEHELEEAPIPHFKIGQKKLYLQVSIYLFVRALANTIARPNFTVSLVKDQKLSPSFAKFHVPLWFNKLDLRDFLYHAYNVRAFNIRSSIIPRPYETSRSDKPWPKRKFFRRQPLKFMIIEMDKPFYWPKEKDWEAEG